MAKYGRDLAGSHYNPMKTELHQPSPLSKWIFETVADVSINHGFRRSRLFGSWTAR